MAEFIPTVLMATYNGGPWLRPQLESIRRQQYSNWQLLISDDGSTDNSVTLIEEFANRDPRIRLLPQREGAPGHTANFEYLMQTARARGAETVFLSDQDDLWHPEKFGEQLSDLQTAAACFADLEVIDAQGNELGGFLEMTGLAPPADLAHLIAQNSVVGCSMALRSELLQLALPFPPRLENHDWWLALCAMASGGLAFNAKRLVNYRQHGKNTIGMLDLRSQARRSWDIVRRQQRVLESKVQAVRELRQRLRAAGRPVPAVLERYLEAFSGRGRIARCKGLLSREFRPCSSFLLAAQLLAVLSH